MNVMHFSCRFPETRTRCKCFDLYANFNCHVFAYLCGMPDTHSIRQSVKLSCHEFIESHIALKSMELTRLLNEVVHWERRVLAPLA